MPSANSVGRRGFDPGRVRVVTAAAHAGLPGGSIRRARAAGSFDKNAAVFDTHLEGPGRFVRGGGEGAAPVLRQNRAKWRGQMISHSSTSAAAKDSPSWVQRSSMA